ncbi:hypothetical protein [Phenylobacterium sp.]|uniref:hypothetical protein n=1 Tax=Phenylobacterium sp. TaxID=1871053 RepID=UPI002737B535|nr:hypothetical protein [Phenylobacterium sp.]MDP3869942.1 hypothetical protein [Phenylobacterium sp.]
MAALILIDTATGLEIKPGDIVTDFRGDRAVMVGGEPPRNPASTGRIRVRDLDDTLPRAALGEASYYPGVFGAKWVDGATKTTT